MSIASSGAGHGGRRTGSAWMDPGAVGNGYNEADLTRKINAKIIAATGVRDTTDNVATTVNGNINNIAANINKGPDGWALSSHLNSFKEPTATGVEVLYGSKDSAAMAAKVSAAIAKVLGIADRGAKDGTWLGIANGSGPGKKVLLIEWGFVSNPNDMKALNAKMDEAVAAMLAVFGYESKKPAPTQVIEQGSKDKIKNGLGYRVHVQSKAPYKGGTLGYVKAGETAGTTGKGLRAEWLEVLYDGKGSPIEINAHVQRKGWLGYRAGSQGTRGQALRMEAVKIRIVDKALAAKYDIEYRAHVQTTGWGPWVKNGETAGTTGKAKRLEAIQIRLKAR